MSQQEKGKINVCWTSRPVTRLGHQGEKSFLRGGQNFQTMSNSFKIRPTQFSCGGKIFLGRLRPPLVTGLWTSIHKKKKTFTCILYAHSQFLWSLGKFDLANHGVRQPVQPHTFFARLLVLDETLAQPDIAVANCSDVG